MGRFTRHSNVGHLFSVPSPFNVPKIAANMSEWLALGELRYRIYCSRDYARDTSKKNDSIAIFTADFEGCMDACAAWTKYVVPKHDSKDPNWNCEAVSFIPAWTNRSAAAAGGASGNCYLKPGPVSIDKLRNNTINVDVHAALWQSG